MPAKPRDLEDAVLVAASRPGDVVMVKGSNSIRMALIVQALKERFAAAAGADGVEKDDDPMLTWLADSQRLSERAQRLPLHHLPDRRRRRDGAPLRVLVRPGDHLAAAPEAGQGPADPRGRPAIALLTKRGTPTMGGLMILAGRRSCRRCCGPTRATSMSGSSLIVDLGFGAIGFYDDYLKVTKQSHKGFSGRARLALEAVIAGRRPAS